MAVCSGATVNVHVASCSATPTALPASSGDRKTTCGHSNVSPLTQAGMSRVIFSRSSPASSAGRFFGLQAHPDRQQRERRPSAEQPVMADLDLAERHALDVVRAVREQDHDRPDRVAREVLCGLLHRGHVVGVDTDGLAQRGVQALPVGRRDGAQTRGQRGDRLGAVEHVQVDAAGVVDRLARELDDAEARVAGDQVGAGLVDAIGDPFQGGPELVPGCCVLQDRGGEVQYQGDIGSVRGGQSGGATPPINPVATATATMALRRMALTLSRCPGWSASVGRWLVDVNL